jgi:hypothetical protein
VLYTNVKVGGNSIEYNLCVLVVNYIFFLFEMAVTESVWKYVWCEGPVFLVVTSDLEMPEK